MGFADQMNAIINGCKPYLNQNKDDYCGPYLMDLTESNSFNLGQSIKDLPRNSSCTYRAVTTCGYPKAEFRIQNSTITNDFDIAWASLDGVQRDDDLGSGYNFNLTTTVNGAMQSQASDSYTSLVADPNAPQITGAAWD
jgi:hypothetical protein